MLKYENIGKEVDKIMSGYILKTEADDIFDQAYQQGMEQGIEKGIEKGIEQEK